MNKLWKQNNVKILYVFFATDYRTIDSSATSPADYSSSSGTVQFNPGEDTKQIDISILNDNDVELQEQFMVQLLRGAVIVNQNRILILDDDGEERPETFGKIIILFLP